MFKKWGSTNQSQISYKTEKFSLEILCFSINIENYVQVCHTKFLSISASFPDRNYPTYKYTKDLW